MLFSCILQILRFPSAYDYATVRGNYSTKSSNPKVLIVLCYAYDVRVLPGASAHSAPDSVLTFVYFSLLISQITVCEFRTNYSCSCSFCILYGRSSNCGWCPYEDECRLNHCSPYTSNGLVSLFISYIRR